jgi:Fic family protein
LPEQFGRPIKNAVAQPQLSWLNLLSWMTRPVLTIPDAQKMLDVTYRTARINIDKLVAAGVLTQVTEASYGKLYAATEIIEILS